VLGDAAPPATMVYVPPLAAPEYLVEIEAWAAVPDSASEKDV
jgi:enamine deaminase RidA (YjgF/YER057c/UK114 family)